MTKLSHETANILMKFIIHTFFISRIYDTKFTSLVPHGIITETRSLFLKSVILYTSFHKDFNSVHKFLIHLLSQTSTFLRVVLSYRPYV